MKLVGFDATPLEVTHRSGVSQHVACLLDALVARRDDWRYALLASRELRGWIPPGTLGPQGTRFPNRWLWMQMVLPIVLARLRPAVCHFTNSLAPLACPSPYIVSIHDMSLFLHPETQPRKSLLVVRALVPVVARRAAVVCAVSESARQDIVSTLRLPADKVRVVYASAAPRFRPVSDGRELARVRATYDLPDAFVLAVGTVEPRKNLARLLTAIAEARRQGRREELVIVGPLGWKYREIVALMERPDLRNAVRTIGYVPDADMPALYTLARALAFPSLYEGFGLPILEAMACGTPVLTSDRSSMKELGGGAALLVDPDSADAIRDGLVRILTDDTLRHELTAAGRERAARYSWARVAEVTAGIYGSVAS